MVRLSALIALLLAYADGLAFAAGFECSNAKTETEKTICSDSSLLKADEEMSAAFRAALKRGRGLKGLRREQWAWLRAREHLCVYGVEYAQVVLA